MNYQCMVKNLIIILSLLLSINVNAQDSISIKKGLQYSLQYIGDYFYNATGGIDKGSAFMGLVAMELSFSSDSAGIWKGGNLMLKAQSIHGKSITDNYVGDYQVLSNIDGGEHTYLHELWYSQEFKNSKIIVGLQDVNVQFVASEGGSHFINSSFGIPSVISSNVPCALFPLTNLGITYIHKIKSNNAISIAIYDGNPMHFDINKYNTDWKFKKSDGIFSIVEYAGKLSDKLIYKLGAYNHSGLIEYNDITNTEEIVFENNNGIYSLIDAEIYKLENDNKSINGFIQIMKSPERINQHHAYVGGGFVFSNFAKEDSYFGISMAHARFINLSKKSETAIEFIYQFKLVNNIYLQPDIQYIINPIGTGVALKNSCVGGLRIHLEI